MQRSGLSAALIYSERHKADSLNERWRALDWILYVTLQFSTGAAGVPDFQKALEPLRQTLSEYPYLGGKAGPSYADHYIASMFMVSLSFSHYPSNTLFTTA